MLKIIKNLFITINMPGRHLFAGRPEQIVYATFFFSFFPRSRNHFFFRALPLDVHISKRRNIATPKGQRTFFFPPGGGKKKAPASSAFPPESINNKNKRRTFIYTDILPEWKKKNYITDQVDLSFLLGSSSGCLYYYYYYYYYLKEKSIS